MGLMIMAKGGAQRPEDSRCVGPKQSASSVMSRHSSAVMGEQLQHNWEICQYKYFIHCTEIITFINEMRE